MGAVLQMSVQLESTTCWSCGIEFAMPLHKLKALRESKEPFFCPNGHEAVFKKSVADELREQLAAKQRDLAFQKSQREAAERRENNQIQRALKAERKVQRAEVGVCTKCNRTVSQLAKHMKMKHGTTAEKKRQKHEHAKSSGK